MDNTVWMVVVGEVAAVVHSVTIGTLAIAQRLSSNKYFSQVFAFIWWL